MIVSRRQFLRAGGSAALLAASGCDQMPEQLLFGLARDKSPSGPFQPPRGDSLDLITQALNRLSFGPCPGEYDRVKGLGGNDQDSFQAYVEEQLAPKAIDDSRCDAWLRRCDETLGQPAGEMFEYQPSFLLNEMMRATVLRAAYSRRQLYEVMVQFWTDHFNIDASKGDCKWLKAADDREVIRRYALGKFSELLRASALSPAMLWYLDGRVNQRRAPEEQPNENYARELLELHTLGVNGGYDQRDVMEVARCLTGWTVRSRGLFGKGKVEFDPEAHDNEPKVVLGNPIPAGLGPEDLDRVLDIVSQHPATARHLAGKLCRRFMAQEPSAESEAAVADSFLESQGDIPSTLRALFATAQFQNDRGGKLKRPFRFMVSALRISQAQTDAGPAIIDFLHRMGQAPFGYPTPDGYPESGSPWLGTLLWRWNFAVALTENRLQGTRIDLPQLKQRAGGEKPLIAHVLGRESTAEELRAFRESNAGMALLLASPAFQLC